MQEAIRPIKWIIEMHRLSILFLAALMATAAQPAWANQHYVSVQLGAAYSPGIEESLSGVNHPTRCDSLLYRGTGLQPPNDAACRDDTPARLWGNTFDLGTGSVAGLSIGMIGRGLRYELEYLHSYMGSDQALLGGATDSAAFAGKASEWSTAEAPLERVSDYRTNQVFANVYYDIDSQSKWTPYVGIGAGYTRVNFRYYARALRKSAEEYLAVEFAPDWPESAKRAAAGSVSVIDTEVSDTVLGFQLLAGVDYALSEHFSIGTIVRWVQISDIDYGARFALVRSHEPVQADGVTPFDVDLAFEDLSYAAAAVNLKYRF